MEQVTYRNRRKAKNKTFTPHICAEVSEELTEYCKKRNINRTRFVEEAVRKKLKASKLEWFEGMDKDELIERLMR